MQAFSITVSTQAHLISQVIQTLQEPLWDGVKFYGLWSSTWKYDQYRHYTDHIFPITTGRDVSKTCIPSALVIVVVELRKTKVHFFNFQSWKILELKNWFYKRIFITSSTGKAEKLRTVKRFITHFAVKKDVKVSEEKMCANIARKSCSSEQARNHATHCTTSY